MPSETEKPSELLPCPFCGEDVEIVNSHVIDSSDWIRHKKHGKQFCPVEFSGFCIGNEKIASAWNTRSTLPVERGVLEEVRKSLVMATYSSDINISANADSTLAKIDLILEKKNG